jgi:hypothetical protein
MAVQGAFKAKLVDTAKRQYEKLGSFHRGDPALRKSIARYCEEIGVPVPGDRDIDAYHWSAVFISWCMQTAGASRAEFPPVEAHWQYIVRIMDGRQMPFKAHPLADYAPQCGDLLHFNRDGNAITFERAKEGHYLAESGIIVEIPFPGEYRKVDFILGNDPLGTVGRQSAELNENGFMLQRELYPFICVIEVLK